MTAHKTVTHNENTPIDTEIQAEKNIEKATLDLAEVPVNCESSGVKSSGIEALPEQITAYLVAKGVSLNTAEKLSEAAVQELIDSASLSDKDVASDQPNSDVLGMPINKAMTIMIQSTAVEDADEVHVSKEHIEQQKEKSSEIFPRDDHYGGCQAPVEEGMSTTTMLLLGLAGVAACYGGYRYFAGGETDSTLIDLDHSL